jgi:integrase
LLLARAGLRLGEGFALQWPDFDFAGREIRVARAFSDGRLDTPRSGHGRTVDMSRQLEAVLQHLLTERKAETLRRGWREMPTWVFCTTTGTMLNKGNVRRVFVRLLKRAKLPLHFSPHSLRHTFASLLLQQGESPVYVQRQLGHASIRLTVDTYGKWLPMGNKAAVDRLDDVAAGAAAGANGSKVVAKLGPAEEAAAQRLEKSGEPCGTRTRDSLLKRQVLYRLS